MDLVIRDATIDDAPIVSALIHESFNQFVAPDWEPRACEAFLNQTSEESLAAKISQSTYAAVALVSTEIVGVIHMPSPALINLLFVRPNWLRRGVASQLWEAARGHVEAHHPTVKTVELNSTPYAFAAYRALGFYPISEPLRLGGGLATRMACWLPGRSLANSENAA